LPHVKSWAEFLFPPISGLKDWQRAGGLAVFISESGRRPAIGVVAQFAHHLRLLGPDPANWSRTPIG
jgi:hypothetical protein